jgi:K+-transporting ATPase ATPase A chain
MGWGITQIVVYVVLLALIAKPLGTYMAHVFRGEHTFMDRVVRPVEKLTYRLCGIDETREMGVTGYAVSLIVFNLAVLLFIYVILRLQGHLPLNPAHVPDMSPTVAFNTAVSFVTNTNWQVYVPDTAVSYLSQMLALARENFVSAAVGMAAAVAFIRGLTRHSSRLLGNFWVDMTRSFLYVLLPLSIIIGLFLVSQGVVQNLNGPTHAVTLQGTVQTIAQGPFASQESIKELGTNGGGSYNANSAHPYENPTPLSNMVEMLALLAIPVAFTYTFGRFAGDQRQGWTLFTAAMVILLMSVAVMYASEQKGNPILAKRGANEKLTSTQAGGNMEGKEVRFGIFNSALFATITTDASCGAVNAMHDSFTPLGGLVPMFNMETGEVIFGGVGAGLYGMLVFVVLAVFIAGLMVGRTPEYLGKKIEAYDVKLVMIVLMVLSTTILSFTAWAAVSDWGKAGLNNAGPHGFSEILYAFSSCVGNNGSAFAGLSGNETHWDTTTALAMLIGRFLMIVPILALAGNLAGKKLIPASAGTFQCEGFTFIALLIGTVLLVGALTFLPALAMGPVVEHYLMQAGTLF